jgi:cellulose synthase/poly-beta-1,6-N-acetylglucosamine synthase-like glycosyltransferase
MITKITREKYLLIFFLLCINTILSTCATLYPSRWYIFLIILALSSTINTINVMLITGYKLKKYFEAIKSTSTTLTIQKQHKIVYVIPCYNETRTEIEQTIQSIVECVGRQIR